VVNFWGIGLKYVVADNKGEVIHLWRPQENRVLDPSPPSTCIHIRVHQTPWFAKFWQKVLSLVSLFSFYCSKLLCKVSLSFNVIQRAHRSILFTHKVKKIAFFSHSSVYKKFCKVYIYLKLNCHYMRKKHIWLYCFQLHIGSTEPIDICMYSVFTKITMFGKQANIANY